MTTSSSPWRSACSVGAAAAISVFFAGIFHLQHPYMALVFSIVLSTLPRPSWKRLWYRISALTLGVCSALLLLTAFPEEPWFYIPLLSIIAASGYASILKHWGAGAAASFSFFFLATHIASISVGFHTEPTFTAMSFWFQAFIAIVVSYLTMFLLPKEQERVIFPSLPVSSIITMTIVIAIAALIDASIETDQGGRLMMGSISTIAALEISQSTYDFPLKLGGYLIGMIVSIAFIIIVSVLGNDISFYLLALAVTFAFFEWMACRYLKQIVLYRSISMMLAFSVLMLPTPDTSLLVPYYRICVSFVGFFIAIAIFIVRRELTQHRIISSS